MDLKKNLFNFFSRAQYGALPDRLIVGNWEIWINKPFGFVVKNLKTPEEFHFFAPAEGWITGRNSYSKGNPSLLAMNSLGQCVGQPVLVDQESTKDSATVLSLRQKYEKEGLSSSEMEQLLLLSGMICKKK